MKKSILFFLLLVPAITIFGQNQLRAKIGYLSTYNYIAEYSQAGNINYMLDSVEIDQKMSGILAGLEVDLDIGKKFFMVTGFSYSQKGMSGITYTDILGNTKTKSAKQNYLGVSFQLKYHYKFNNDKIGLFLASGPKVDFAVGGPNYSEFSASAGYRLFQAFGSFNVVEFCLYTNLGVSYKLGPGEIIFDLNMLNGLSDATLNKYIVTKSFSLGAALGYSFYLD